MLKLRLELEEAGGQNQAGAISWARGTEGWSTGRMAAVEVAVFMIYFQAGAQRTCAESERKRGEVRCQGFCLYRSALQ